jgi:hypothetical protein
VLVRAPLLYESLRCFCLGAFAELSRDVRHLAFAFEERDGLYEYRPLARAFVEERAGGLLLREDARLALAELEREPAAQVYAAANGGLAQSVLLTLLFEVVDRCPTLDWDDGAFDRAYSVFELDLFRERHAYLATAPLVGLSAGGPIELGNGLRVRPAGPDESTLELARMVDELPDAPAEVADAVAAIRLATAGPVAARAIDEQLDGRPYDSRPVLPIAGTRPPGEPTRLDPFRGKLAADLLERLVLCDEDPELGDAIDLWEVALVGAGSPGDALTALLGGLGEGPWAAQMRAAVLLGIEPRDDLDTARRAVIEVLVHGDRAALIESLDEAMLGRRPRPVGYFGKLAAAGPRGASVAA